jgi:hypothetical protein
MAPSECARRRSAIRKNVSRLVPKRPMTRIAWFPSVANQGPGNAVSSLMSVGKKMAAVAALLAIGLLAAMAFRKSDAPGDADSASSHEKFQGQVIRRLTDDSASSAPRAQVPFRLATQVDTSFHPPTAATRSAAVEVAVMPHIIERSVSPVGALLQPLESEPAAEIAEPLELRPAAEGAGGESGPRAHLIVDGDTLSKLAASYLGSSERYLEIFNANRDVLKRPDLLPIGVSLKIPPRGSLPASTSAGTPAEAKLVPISADAWRPAH